MADVIEADTGFGQASPHVHYANQDSSRNAFASNDQVEKPFLYGQQHAKPSLRDIIGDPTALGVLGFVMSLSPLSANLMGWRGSVNSGAAEIGVYFFFGGILMLVSGLIELILSNTFMSLVFMSFGSFFLFYGATLQPFFAAAASYGGPETPEFRAGLGFIFLFMALLSFFFMICAFRINIAYVFLLFTVMLGLALVAAALWKTAEDRLETARQCTKAAGGVFFACSLAGWYLLLALMLSTVDFPIQLPLGDLSNKIRGRSDRWKDKNAEWDTNEAFVPQGV